MSRSPRKLLGHPPLKEDESLPSFVIRLSKLNFYESPSVLAEFVLDEMDDAERLKDRLDFPRQAPTFERLANMAQMECSRLYEATAHSFALALTPPETRLEFLRFSNNQAVSLLPRGAGQKQLRPNSSGQFCPKCLVLSMHHRLIWMPISTSVCLQHNCLLIDQCYKCGKPVTIREIVEARCRTCGTDLRGIQSIQINEDTLGLLSQQVLQSWLLNKSAAIKNDLPQQPPRVLYRVLEGLRFVAQELAESGSPFLHKSVAQAPATIRSRKLRLRSLTPYQSYCVYTTAFKGLRNWPKGFFDLLDAQCVQAEDERRMTRLGADLGSIYTQWLQQSWQSPEFGFVQEAFDQYIANHYGLSRSILRSYRFRSNPDLLARFAYITVNKAAELVGVAPSTIEKLIRSGQLASYEASEDLEYALVKRDDVLALRNNWRFVLGLRDATQILGISEDIVLDMVKIGFLFAERGPENGFSRWMFRDQGLQECINTVLERVMEYPANVQEKHFQPLTLTDVSRILMVVGLNAAYIIKRVAEGKLRAYHRSDAEFRFRDLLFDPDDVSQCTEAIKAEHDWIGRQEVTKRLSIKDTTLAKWVNAELLVPVVVHVNAQYFARDAVEKFTTDYVTSEGAAALLGIGELTVQRWTRQGRIHAISGPNIDDCHAYLFSKEGLLQWRDERLPFGEAAELLGVSKATLHLWATEGKIASLDDMGGKQRWFSRRDVLKLQGAIGRKSLPPNEN